MDYRAPISEYSIYKSDSYANWAVLTEPTPTIPYKLEFINGILGHQTVHKGCPNYRVHIVQYSPLRLQNAW